MHFWALTDCKAAFALKCSVERLAIWEHRSHQLNGPFAPVRSRRHLHGHAREFEVVPALAFIPREDHLRTEFAPKHMEAQQAPKLWPGKVTVMIAPKKSKHDILRFPFGSFRCAAPRTSRSSVHRDAPITAGLPKQAWFFEHHLP